MKRFFFKKASVVLALLILLPFLSFSQEVSLLQTTNNVITKKGIACNGQLTALPGEQDKVWTMQAQHARLYNLSALGFTKFELTHVSFAVQDFKKGTAVNFPVNVKVYASTGGVAANRLTLKGETAVNITAGMVGTVIDVPFTPVIVTSPEMLIVVSIPDGSATGTQFYIGANSNGQTSPPYYQSDQCGRDGAGFKSYTDLGRARPDTHVILFPTGRALTQCSPGNVTLNTQQQVDQFKIDYPNCTQIAGNLLVGFSNGTSNITNLSALNNLTSVGGVLQIENNPLLTSVESLSKLQTVGGFLVIAANSELANLEGLRSLKSVGADLTINGNAKLANLKGLRGVKSISGWLTIGNNGVLTNLSGLENIATGISKLVIKNNAALAACDLPNFCTYIANPTNTHPREIVGNAANCLNEAAVVAACTPSPQCPTGNVVLTSQQAVNQFKIDYPSCTKISGDLFIGVTSGASDITDLSPLNNLISVGGFLHIEKNPLLASVNGLSKLQTIGGYLVIDDNNVLPNLDGFTSLIRVTSNLSVRKNPLLANLNGLSGLTSLSGWLTVENNAVLANISGLENITTGITNLIIKQNAALEACDLPNFCTYIANPANTHPREISGNKANCLNEAAVVAACNPPQCPTGSVTLATQAQVNQFKINYPNCTQISGTLTIGGGTLITDLSPLSNIKSITGHLHIQKNVADLDGLNNITSIGAHLSVVGNGQLSNLNGLSGLTSIGSSLFIQTNSVLTSLNGLSSLTSIGGYILISGNKLLNDISALGNTTFNPASGNGLTIIDNEALAVCNLPNFCTYLAKPSNTYPRNISGNKANCLDVAAVVTACATSQCPPGNVTLATQAQVNQFSINYPDCTEIAGNLFIGVGSGTSNITDISPLNKITKIRGNFNIERSALTAINGLNNLESIDGYVFIGLNPSLTQINNLSKLVTIGASLHIRDNPLLTTVNGLGSLETVGEFFQIRNSNELTNIDGFSSLKTIGEDLIIQNNPKLTNLNGLSNLRSIALDIYIDKNAVLSDISALKNTSFSANGLYGLTIVNNPALAVCNLPNFCTYLANPSSTHPRNIESNLANCLDEAAVKAACSVLPVTLTSFTAKANNNSALLQWETASEQNNKGFEIWRSGDDGKFVKIGKVESTSPNSTIKTIYAFTDKQPLNGNNYYKLVQLDLDGTITELAVRDLNFGLSTSNIRLYPNPTATNEVTVNWGIGTVKLIKLIDLSGRILQTVRPQLIATSISLSLTKYPVGTYLVHIERNSTIEIRKVVKL